MYKNILGPVDGKETSAAGLLEAVRVAKGVDGCIRLVHVINELIPDAARGPRLYAQDQLRALRQVSPHRNKNKHDGARKASASHEVGTSWLQ